jgi:hypothetical protein
MFLFRKWFKNSYPRTLMMGLLVVALLACSLPLTHADHGSHGHGHHHDEISSLLANEAPINQQNETDERSTHQHMGLNEHNPGHLSSVGSDVRFNIRTEQWRFVKIQPPRQDFLYALERPPRA